MPLRSRTGRKERTRKDTTLAFLKDKNRDCFYYIDRENRIEPLTFVEAAKIFEAKAVEKPCPFHDQHYTHIQVAMGTFQEELTRAAIQTHQLGAKLGPNEKKALAFINSFKHVDFVEPAEKELIRKAQQAIEIGKFQKLPREINKLLKTAKQNGTLKAPEKLASLLKILNNYPLTDIREETTADYPEKKNTRKKLNTDAPKIIISESFIG